MTVIETDGDRMLIVKTHGLPRLGVCKTNPILD